MRHLLSTLLVLTAATPLLGQTQVVQPAPVPAVRVGDSLPPVVIEDLRQTEAGSFTDFYGRVVLLEFFAYWCSPCALSVPHLNMLQEKFGGRGLSILAVTTESEKKTVPWIEKHGAKYAYARDSSGELLRLFQVQSIPTAVLIDAFGTVLWVGDPRRLREDLIENALADTLPLPVWEWPEDARPLAKLLEKVELAAALEEAAKLPAREGFDAQGLVRGRIAPLLARFNGLVQRAEYVGAFELGEQLEKGLATLPEGEKVKARLEQLRADEDVKRHVAAETRMSDLEARGGALRKPADAQQLRTEVAEFLESKPGLKYERRAKTLLETLDRGLGKLGKKP